MIYNHITLRVPGPEKHLLINPFGLHYTEITASNLVKIDLDGNILSDSRWPINPAGLAPHATVHREIDRAHCVMHTHTTAGLAVACTKGGLSMTNFYSAQLYGKVAYHDFEGITVDAEEGPRMLKAMGGKPILILRNHGLLAWGETLPQAFAHLWTMQRACEIQVAAMGMGDELIEIPNARAGAGDAGRLAVRSQVRRRRRHVQRADPPDRPQGSVLQELSRGPPMRVLVIGAGAVGGWLAGALARGGAEVALVARGPTLAAIRADGLTLIEGERRQAFRLPASRQRSGPAARRRRDPGGEDLWVCRGGREGRAGVGAWAAWW